MSNEGTSVSFQCRDSRLNDVPQKEQTVGGSAAVYYVHKKDGSVKQSCGNNSCSKPARKQ